MPNPTNYAGQKFGRLTAIKFTGRYTQSAGGNKKRIWEFQCDCGKVVEKVMEKVKKGDTKSCGCLMTTRNSIEVVQHMVFTDSYDDGNLTEEQFLHMSQLPCYWCGEWNPSIRKHRYFKEVTFAYHGLDRIDNERGHDVDNVRPCCWLCNELRRNRTEEKFLDRITKIYNHRCK